MTGRRGRLSVAGCQLSGENGEWTVGSEQWTESCGRKTGAGGGIAAPRGKRVGRACEKRRVGGIGVRQLRPRQSVRHHKPRPPADCTPLFGRALCRRPSARWAARAGVWGEWAMDSGERTDFRVLWPEDRSKRRHRGMTTERGLSLRNLESEIRNPSWAAREEGGARV
jgi:hypothetical protein